MSVAPHDRRAFLFVVAAAGAFGALAFFASLALRAGFDPLVFVSLRFVVAAGALTPALRRSWQAPGRLIAAAFALGAIVYAAQALMLTLALERADTSLVAVLFGTYPLFIFLLLLPRRPQLARAVFLVPLIGVVAGGALLVGFSGADGADVGGVVLAIGSAVAFATFVIASDVLTTRLSAATLAWCCCVGAASSTVVLAAALGRMQVDVDPDGWLWITAAGLLSTAFAFTMLFRALPAVGPATAGVVLGAEPIASVVLAAIFLGDHLTAAQLTGGAMTIISIVFLQRLLGTRAFDVAAPPRAPEA